MHNLSKNCWCPFKIQCARMAKWTRILAEDPKTARRHRTNAVTRTTWCPEFVHPLWRVKLLYRQAVGMVGTGGLSDQDSGDAIWFARPWLEVVQSVGKKMCDLSSLPELFFLNLLILLLRVLSSDLLSKYLLISEFSYWPKGYQRNVTSSLEYNG